MLMIGSLPQRDFFVETLLLGEQMKFIPRRFRGGVSEGLLDKISDITRFRRCKLEMECSRVDREATCNVLG